MRGHFARRRVLQIAAGGLAVGCFLGSGKPARGAAAGARMNAWILIGPDGMVTVRVAHTEMGQGIHTLIAMLVAEELEVDAAGLKIESAPVAADYDNPQFQSMVTGNSSSAMTSFDPLRVAGAQARLMLVAAAARQWRAAVEDCAAVDGQVRNRRTGAVMSYGSLAAAAAGLAPPRDVVLKPPSAWRLLGRSMPRLEGPEKVHGSARFGIDIRVPEMLIAAVLNCPVAGGKLARVDPGLAMALPGLVKVLALKDAVIVVANSSWAALQGIEALQPEWDEGANATLDSAEITSRLDKALAAPGLVVTERGSVPAPEVQMRLALRFEVPLLAHAALEPPTATVAIGSDGVDVWAPTQVQTLAREAVAATLEIAPERVRIHTTLAGGSFGRKLQVDYLCQAALAAKAAGRPVKLIWSRREDLQHDFYRPPAATAIEIGLDAGGLPVSWDQRLAVPDLQISFAAPSASAREIIDPFAVEGAAPLPYAISRHRLTWHDVPLALPMGWWRSVGHSFNAWFIEHALDVAAHRTGRDPVALRLALLKDRPRHQAVLRALALLWASPPASGRFRGTAVHECFGSVVAQSAEISLTGGLLRVHRVVCAVDCGTALDPDGVRAQIEGGIIFGLTAALHGEITLQNGRVQQENLDSYRLLALRDTPEIEVVIVASDAAPGGVGEVGVPPIAPALSNAIFAGTGQPVTRLPIRLGG
jgi:isoquinoline 1-oxidoreductase beta subunit